MYLLSNGFFYLDWYDPATSSKDWTVGQHITSCCSTAGIAKSGNLNYPEWITNEYIGDFFGKPNETLLSHLQTVCSNAGIFFFIHGQYLYFYTSRTFVSPPSISPYVGTTVDHSTFKFISPYTNTYKTPITQVIVVGKADEDGILAKGTYGSGSNQYIEVNNNFETDMDCVTRATKLYNVLNAQEPASYTLYEGGSVDLMDIITFDTGPQRVIGWKYNFSGGVGKHEVQLTTDANMFNYLKKSNVINTSSTAAAAIAKIAEKVAYDKIAVPLIPIIKSGEVSVLQEGTTYVTVNPDDGGASIENVRDPGESLNLEDKVVIVPVNNRYVAISLGPQNMVGEVSEVDVDAGTCTVEVDADTYEDVICPAGCEEI
jgi:hypothetical protein